MRTYSVFLSVFAALLLCDYGMFSSPSPSRSEKPSTVTSGTSHPYTNATTIPSLTEGAYTGDTDYSSGADESNNSSEENQLTATMPSYPPTSESSAANISRINDSAGVGISSGAQPKEDPKQRGSEDDKGGQADSGSLTGGIIILIFILILIALLLGILYFLRRKGRSYSFDLTRVEVSANDYVDTPLRSDQQGISYEQTNKDLAVDYIQEDKSEEKTNPVANGSAGEKTEQTTSNDNDEQNVPEENSFSSDSSLTTPGLIKKVEFDLDLDLLGGGSDLNDSTDAEATDTPQNENNNNVSNSGQGTAEDIFTEISLDESK